MQLTFRVLSGSAAGSSITPAGAEFLAGRHPDALLCFSAEAELTVSGRHAHFELRDGTWHVTDLNSLNGTWVNGNRISGAVALRAGDRVQFGAGGPSVMLEERAGAATQELRRAIRHEKFRLRLVAAALLSIVCIVAAAVVIGDGREKALRDEDRAAMAARIDSLIHAGRRVDASLDAEVPGLRSALKESESTLQRLRSEVATADGSGDNNAGDMEQELLAATAALQRQQHAATLDYPLIQRRNRAAIAMIWVEYADGTVATGTAFSVRSDGTLLTNRHVVRGQDGTQEPRRIAARFSDSDQTFPAELLGVSESWDVAAIRVLNILGSVPTIRRMNSRADTLPKGSPLALIGFGLGGEPARSGGAEEMARPLVSAAVIHAATPRMLELEGIGAVGASGSPIIDAEGDVIGMLYGGRDEGDRHILVAVPAHALLAFLASVR